ncbi:MAG: hypothetical protein QN120_13745 [Armatimonadota bacterium]|nr:hypothetical protein [Armatimonadota bacterium]
MSLPDTLTYLALAYAKLGETQRAIETSEEAIRILAEMNFANHQPQRIFWHHYLILGMAGHESRLAYLERAVQLIEAQAATLSPAQGRRLRREVPLNREILEAWHAHRPTGDLALASRPASAPAAGGHVPAQFTAQL